MIIQMCSQPEFKGWDKAAVAYSFFFSIPFLLAAMRPSQIQLAVIKLPTGQKRLCNNLT